MVVMGCGGAPAEEEEEEEEVPRTEIILDFATFWPATDFQPSIGEGNWMEVLSKRVLEETKGYKLKWVKTFSVSPSALLTGVKAGTYDVITSGPGYTAGVFPLWEGAEYPSNFPGKRNALIMSMAKKALWENFEPLRTEFLAQGIVPMYFWSVGPGWFLMTTGNGVKTLEDFAGKTIRVANPGSVATINALGATGLYCPMSAALEKFQQGLIEGILCPTDTPKGFGLGAYVREATYCPVSYDFVFMNVMNKDTWEGLPQEVKDIFTSTNAKWTEYNGKLRTWGEYDGLMYCRSSLGWNVTWFEYYLPTENPTEYQRWVDTLYPSLVNTWIGGNATRQALWNEYSKWYDYYNKTEPYSTWTHSYPTQPPVPTFP